MYWFLAYYTAWWYHYLDNWRRGARLPFALGPKHSLGALGHICYWNLEFLNNVIIFKNTGSPPSGLGDHRWFWLSCLNPLVFFAHKDFKTIWLFYLLILSVLDENYSRNAWCALNHSKFLLSYVFICIIYNTCRLTLIYFSK